MLSKISKAIFGYPEKKEPKGTFKHKRYVSAPKVDFSEAFQHQSQSEFDPNFDLGLDVSGTRVYLTASYDQPSCGVNYREIFWKLPDNVLFNTINEACLNVPNHKGEITIACKMVIDANDGQVYTSTIHKKLTIG